MEQGLRDRVAVVVGGSSGLGRAGARELAREGARVVIAAGDAERLRRAAEKLAVLAAFLAPERAGCLAGATIQVDGGYTQGLL